MQDLKLTAPPFGGPDLGGDEYWVIGALKCSYLF